ncbi:MAG: hypothetical protein GXY47_13780 [Acidobacteria bacterium]|nr:hypothetical protein [Acidobacteriota bacterium]
MIVVLCLTATLAQGLGPVGPGDMAADAAVGGLTVCNGFLDGFAVGMGIATLAGCVWCAGVGIAAKVIDVMAC